VSAMDEYVKIPIFQEDPLAIELEENDK